MNERIRELMIQAMTETGRLEEGVQASYQQFAKLIIEECAQAADTWMEESEGKTFWVGHGIKEHFGVE